VSDDLGAKAPKYLQIAARLRRDIREGKYLPGTRLPAETAHAEQFRVSPITLRNAISVLRAEGLIESRHEIGTFVRETRRLHRRSRDRYGRARKDRQLLTRHLRHEIVFAGRAPLSPEVAAVMDAEPGTEVVVRRRRLYHRETGRPEEIGALTPGRDIENRPLLGRVLRMEPSTVDPGIPIKGLCCCLTLFVGGPLLIMLSRVGQKKGRPSSRPGQDATRADEGNPTSNN
jgi:DNA-binding transcriptional regulator YhcF (GntR family)